jgi:hypothetical protein
VAGPIRQRGRMRARRSRVVSDRPLTLHTVNKRNLELRASISLSRLWGQYGKRAQAHGLLAEVYGWFTEGFDTADLQELDMKARYL